MRCNYADDRTNGEKVGGGLVGVLSTASLQQCMYCGLYDAV